MNDPTQTGTLPRAPRAPLSVPAFRALWGAAIVSWIGSFVQDVAERWLMLDLTHSPLPVALLSTVFVSASMVALLPAGALADRVDRRGLVIASQIAQALVAVGVALAAFAGRVSPALLLGASALAGLGMALGQPAWSALVPEMVEREAVPEAIALNSAGFNVARALGPALGGLVLSGLGAPVSFLVNGATFAAVIVALVAFRATGEASSLAPLPPREPLLRAFAEPFARVRTAPELRAPFTAMLTFSAGCSVVYALSPAYARTTLGASAEQYGILIGAMGIGAVLGATALRRARARLSPRVLVASAMLVFSASALALARVHVFAVAVACFVPVGVGWVSTFSSLQALVQVWTPDGMRARVLALYTMSHFLVWGAGSSAGGAIAARWGVPAAMTVGVLATVLAALTTARLPLPGSFAPRAEAAQ